MMSMTDLPGSIAFSMGWCSSLRIDLVYLPDGGCPAHAIIDALGNSENCTGHSAFSSAMRLTQSHHLLQGARDCHSQMARPVADLGPPERRLL
jgi:hypothetical protein